MSCYNYPALEVQDGQLAVESVEVQEFCQICGDEPSGYHYGVLSCEGCKCFYRRSLNRVYPVNCDRKCTVSVNTRRNCRVCRFQKCITSGMSIEKAYQSPKRNGKRNHRQENIPMEQTSETSNDSSYHEFNQSSYSYHGPPSVSSSSSSSIYEPSSYPIPQYHVHPNSNPLPPINDAMNGHGYQFAYDKQYFPQERQLYTNNDVYDYFYNPTPVLSYGSSAPSSSALQSPGLEEFWQFYVRQ